MWTSIRGVAVAIVLGFAAAVGFASSASAVPVTYDFTLTATDIDSPFGGIAALPAGPFSGSFTFDGPLAANLSDSIVALTGFDLTIGSVSWGVGDIVQSRFSTDILGQVTEFTLGAALLPSLNLVIYEPALNGQIGWAAYDTGCGYTPSAGGIEAVSGSCIVGETGSLAFSVRVEVPEPATLALFGAGLAGLGWIARKRKTT